MLTSNSLLKSPSNLKARVEAWVSGTWSSMLRSVKWWQSQDHSSRYWDYASPCKMIDIVTHCFVPFMAVVNHMIVILHVMASCANKVSH